ncbi:nucleolar protein 56 isoform X4 [Prunus persica]|uniref:nucleolar protein 56 isoform X4 n=1 Tax=Prunus persica TaxID=3760 RepID=UPI0009AB3ED1|nr:nucleolar protein 56 isoform X4 [Prunus persica]
MKIRQRRLLKLPKHPWRGWRVYLSTGKAFMISQIPGAEKALFRALKTRGNTPKYRLIFHSSFIGRASARNKGRMARYLANKCSIAKYWLLYINSPTHHLHSHPSSHPYH